MKLRSPLLIGAGILLVGGATIGIVVSQESPIGDNSIPSNAATLQSPGPMIGDVHCMSGEGMIDYHADGPFDFDANVSTPEEALLVHFKDHKDPQAFVRLFTMTSKSSTGATYSATTDNGLRGVVGIGHTQGGGWGVVNSQVCGGLYSDGA